MSYSVFARSYDLLMRGVDYGARADYFCAALKRLGHEPGLTIDLACGTGSFTLELAKRGIDVFGLDASPEMLSAAQNKTCAAGKNILYLCQKLQELDLYGTVDTAVCTLDSVNHIAVRKDLREAFRRIALFLNPGGYFLFDANTLYKHREILADHVFVYDFPEVYCIWQNCCEPKSGRVSVSLDLFEHRGSLYSRSSEHFFERAYSVAALSADLRKAGLEVTAVWGDMSFSEPAPNEERIIVAAKKQEKRNRNSEK